MSSITRPATTTTRAEAYGQRTFTAWGTLRILEHLYVRTPAKYRSVLVSGVVSPLFFLALLGFGLGSLVDERQGASSTALGTDNYLQFIGPGLLAISAVLWGFAQGLWPTSNELRWDRTYVLTAGTPVSKAEIAVAHLAWISLRFTASAALFTVVLALAGATTSWWAVLAPLAAGATALAVAGVLCGFTSRQDDEMTFPTILRLGAIPMFLFSGAFFPLTELPAVVAWIARLTPGWHGVALCRDLALGTLAPSSLVHMMYLVVVSAVGVVLTIGGFRQALENS